MRLLIDEITEEKRIDAYLADYMHNFSRAKIQNEIKKGAVLVNSKETNLNLQKIKELKLNKEIPNLSVYLATNKSISLTFASKTFIKYLKF